MLKNRLIRLVVIATVLGLLVTGAASAAPSGSSIPQGIWYGKNSQGLKFTFDVLQSNHGLIVQPTELDLNLVCSGTGTEFEAGFGFIGFGKKINSEGTFRFHLYDELFGTIDFRGTLGETSGSGTELAAIPGLTRDLGAEICSSGQMSWHAHPPGGAPSQGDSNLQYRIVFTKDAHGKVTESISKG